MQNYYKSELAKLKDLKQVNVKLTDYAGTTTHFLNINHESVPIIIEFLNKLNAPIANSVTLSVNEVARVIELLYIAGKGIRDEGYRGTNEPGSLDTSCIELAEKLNTVLPTPLNFKEL